MYSLNHFCNVFQRWTYWESRIIFLFTILNNKEGHLTWTPSVCTVVLAVHFSPDSAEEHSLARAVDSINWTTSNEKVSSNKHKNGKTQLNLRMRKVSYKHLHSILYCQMTLLADSEGPDQTARMRMLIWAIAVRICSKTRFRMVRSICLYTSWSLLFIYSCHG